MNFFWSAIVLILAVNLIVFDTLIIMADNELIAQHVPDGGYDYLSLAGNFSSSGVWSFDSGVSKTSGFHPLFAYRNYSLCIQAVVYVMARSVLCDAAISGRVNLARSMGDCFAEKRLAMTWLSSYCPLDFLPVFEPPKGDGLVVLSTDCHFQPILHSLA